MKNRYLIRVAKYFLYLVVLFALLFAILLALRYTSWETFIHIWGTNRAWLMLAVFIGLPLVYPLFGYVSRETRGNLTENRELIDRILLMSGYRVVEETPERIVCRVSGIRRLTLFFEDRMVISNEGNYIRVEGPRKEVVRFQFRLETYR